jgi:hypothetical protein
MNNGNLPILRNRILSHDFFLLVVDVESLFFWFGNFVVTELDVLDDG